MAVVPGEQRGGVRHRPALCRRGAAVIWERYRPARGREARLVEKVRTLRKPDVRPLADLIDAAIGPVLAAHGFAASDVVVGWPEIVGEHLAAHSEPVKLQWPRRPAGVIDDGPGDPATLVVRVEGAFALELQHLAPVIVERVNTRYGWRCVGRLVLKQGPVGRDKDRPRRLPEPDAAAIEAARAQVGPLEDEGLREALVKLGAAMKARGGVNGSGRRWPAPHHFAWFETAAARPPHHEGDGGDQTRELIAGIPIRLPRSCPRRAHPPCPSSF